MTGNERRRNRANRDTYERLCAADPVLVDIRPAIEVVPEMRPDTILTSGPPMAWSSYTGGQREAIIGAARFEGLASDRADGERKLAAGEIVVDGCHDHGCVGSLAGVYTASMPVFVVRNETHGNTAFCNIYEGTNPRRLNYGVYDEGVHQRLRFIHDEVAPILAEAVRRAGGVALKPIMKRALHMGDELHSRNTAASMLFARELYPHLLDLAVGHTAEVKQAVAAVTEDNYFFLRLSMAAAKSMADAAHGIADSSVVTAMAFNCAGFAIRVSGLGDTWFAGPHADVEAKLFEGHSEDEIAWMGGESTITETVGLGGFAQAAALGLQTYQGGSAGAMIARNQELYQIVVGEHPDFRLPVLDYRGTPVGIDVHKVVDTGVLPAMDIGIAGRDGGQIGAGVVRAPMECFTQAMIAYAERYPSDSDD